VDGSGLKMKGKLLIVLFLLTITTNCMASDWKIVFFGIDLDILKGRSPVKVALGAAASYFAHEAGHMILAKAFGHDAGFDFRRVAVTCADFDEMSRTQQQFFLAGGFMAQATVGTILTIIPHTKNSDFSVGFNSWTAVNSLLYSRQTDITKYPVSDVALLNNGVEISLGTALYGAYLTSINFGDPSLFNMLKTNFSFHPVNDCLYKATPERSHDIF
jgi:hypothetical protein